MAQEDALRMVAEVVDKSTGPLRTIRSALQSFAREGAGHAGTITQGFDKADAALAKTAGTARNVLNPALSTVGITALTVTGAIAGIGAAMRSFGSSASQLGQISRDTGIAADRLREVQGILGKVGVDAGQSAAGLQQFAENMRLARDGIGPIMEFLRTQGRTAEGRRYFNDLADSLRNTKDNSDALMKALEGLEHIQDPAGRRKYAETVLGIGDAARLTDGRLGSLREQIERFRKDNGVLSPDDIKRAEDYDKAMSGLRGSVSKLGDAIARETLPHLSDLAKNLKSFLDDERQGVTPAIVGTIREIATWLRSIDFKALFREAGPGFKQFRDDLTQTLTEVRALLAELGKKDSAEALKDVFREVGNAARDTATAIRSAALAMRALNDVKNGDFSEAFKKLAEIDKLTQVPIGQRKNAEPSRQMDRTGEQLDAMIRGQSPEGAAEAQRQAENLRANGARVAEIEARRAKLQEQIAQHDRLVQGGTDSERSRRQADALKEEMQKLTAELKRLREGQAQQKREGEATVQQQSYDATGGQFGGAKVYTASLGGGAVGAARVGRMLRDRDNGIYLPEGGGGGGSGGLPGGVGPGRRSAPSDAEDEGGGVPRGQAPRLPEGGRTARPRREGPPLRTPREGGSEPEEPRSGRTRRRAEPLGPRGSGEVPDDRSPLERRNFGGGRFNGLGPAVPRVQPREGGPGEQHGRWQRGEDDGTTPPIKGDTFEEKAPGVMRRLMKDFDLTQEEAAVILGNLGHESAGFKAFKEGGGGPGRGWAQWTDPGRKRRFFKYAEDNGLDPKSDEANYGFLKWELENTHKNSIRRLKNAEGVREKMRVFENDFEGAGVKAWGSRFRYMDRANRAYNRDAEQGLPAGSGRRPEILGDPRDERRRVTDAGSSSEDAKEQLREQYRRTQAVERAYEGGDFRGEFVGEMKRRSERGEKFGRDERDMPRTDPERSASLDQLNRGLEASADQERRRNQWRGSGENYYGPDGEYTGSGLRDSPYEPSRRLNLDEIRKFARPQADGTGFTADLERRRLASQDARKAMTPQPGELSPLQRALKSPMNGPKVSFDGSVTTVIEKAGPEARAKTSTSGPLFKEVKLQRGRAMPEASQEA